MADYTQYATLAQEWIEFEKTLPPPVSEQGTTIEQAKKLFNDRRAKLFTDVLGPIGGSPFTVSGEAVLTSLCA
jgi:hypothetical protein